MPITIQVNSASYPQRRGNRVVAYWLWSEGLAWLAAAVCLLAALQVQLFAGIGSGWSHNALQYY